MSQQINLFNPLFLKQKKYFSALNMLQALTLILVGSLVVSFYTNRQLDQTSAQAAQLSAQLAVAQADLANFTATGTTRQPSVTLQSEIQQTQDNLMSMQQAFDTLQHGEMGNTKGYSEYFRAFSREIVDGLWLTGASLVGAGSEVGLRGRTLHPELVAIYVGKLKQEPVMQGKSFATLEMETPMVVEPAKEGAPPAKPVSRPASFTEFDLRSTELKKDQTDGQGVKSQ